MKFQGSAKVTIVCREAMCRAKSEPFLVTLANDDDEDIWLPRGRLPTGWWMNPDEMMEDKIILGYCSEHITEEDKQDFISTEEAITERG